jgi:hypothetical protein
MRYRARLIALLGDELISDEPVAAVELVKNSFDADATPVVVRFEGENRLIPDRIMISDDGRGMFDDCARAGRAQHAEKTGGIDEH